MEILRHPAKDWNKFAVYDNREDLSLDNSQIQKWQLHPMPSWAHQEHQDLTNKCKNSFLDISCRFKKSKYNIEKIYQSKSIVYNTASEALVILDETEKRVFDEIVSNKQKVDQNEMLGLLFYLGLIVYEEDNESFKFHYIRNKSAFENNKTKSFIIYPTHQCNARCFYCFASGDILTQTKMSKETADSVLEFIYGLVNPDDEVVFRWFGGEPLMATEIIDYIIERFDNHFDHAIKYHSIITTNGSLITNEVIDRFKNYWNVHKVHIVLDGYKKEHDKRKNYFEKGIDRYGQVLDNISNLLENDIFVVCRLNLDHTNVKSLDFVLEDLMRFTSFDKFFLHATTLHLPDGGQGSCNYFHYSEYNTFYDLLFRKMLDKGFYKSYLELLPTRLNTICTANLGNSVLINADGDLFKCEQELHNVQNRVGTCKTGIIHNNNLLKWMNTNLEEECTECVFLPICQGGCKYYRQRNCEELTPCTRPKFYMDALLNIVAAFK